MASFVQGTGEEEQPWTSSTVIDNPIATYQICSDRQHYNKVRQLICADAVSLFSEAGKKVTNLSLALKRSTESQAATDTEATASTALSSAPSVLQGLDDASIAAAQQTVDHLTKDLVPKLVFVAQKAWKERAVYARSQRAVSAQEIEGRKLEATAKELGGQVMSGPELGLGNARSSYVKQVGSGLGVTWANSLRLLVQDVLQSIAALAEVCMTEKTRAAVQAAKKARDRSGGSVSPASDTSRSMGRSRAPLMSAAVRQLCLSRTAAVWEACDLASKSLPKDEVGAVRTKWAQRKELMEDGIKEVNEALEAKNTDRFALGIVSDDDDDFGLGDIKLSPGRRRLLRRLAPLLRMGRLLHDRVGELCLVEQPSHDEASLLDLSYLEARAQVLSEAQDDLVAALLYGDYEATKASEEEDGEDDEGEEVEEADDQGTTGLRLASSKTLATQFFEAAREVVEASGSNPKAQLALKDMTKLLDGFTEEEWLGEFDDE